MGWKKCLFSKPRIDRMWKDGKLIYIGNALLSIVIDLRKNWVKDMIDN